MELWQGRRLRIARRGLGVTMVTGVVCAPLVADAGTAVSLICVVGLLGSLCAAITSFGHRPWREVPGHAVEVGVISGATALAWWALLAIGGPVGWLIPSTALVCAACSEGPGLLERWERRVLRADASTAEHDRLPGL